MANAKVKITFAGTELCASLVAQGCGVQLIDLNSQAFSGIFEGTARVGIEARTPDNLAWLFYTFGTTGCPKGVMITHRMLEAMSTAYFADVDSVDASDTSIYAAPLSHGAGLYNFIHVQRGARHVLPASGGFDPQEIFDLARHFGRAHVFAAPTMVKRMTEVAKASGQTGTGLRSVIYGGGPMY